MSEYIEHDINGVSVGVIALGLFAFISLLLIVGRYRLLETSLKFVVSILFIALLVTTLLVLYKPPVEATAGFERPAIFNEVGILFLIGGLGAGFISGAGGKVVWQGLVEGQQLDQPLEPGKVQNHRQAFP